MNAQLLKKSLAILLAGGLLAFGCNTDELAQEAPETNERAAIQPVDLTPEWKENLNNTAVGPGGGVMMQAFYWDVPAGGTWWNVVKGKLNGWANNNVVSMWLPPVSKAQNGPFSMGYDPFDFYDFGQINQQGSTETRFGSRTELEALLNDANSKGIDPIADLVFNHNSGGDLEANPYTGTNTYTDYNPGSGLFFRSASDFHPNAVRNADEGIFGGFPDLSHVQPYVQDWLWKRSNSVGKYYKNTMGFKGWRFDYVKGFGGWVVRDFVDEVGGFAVGEYWDGNAATLKWWVDNTGGRASAFDFAAYYAMEEAFDNGNMWALGNDMLWKRDAWKTVTFVANHDTDIIYDKLQAYAYILTHEGYPCLFYRDYEDWLPKAAMNNLLWIRTNYATGNTTQLYLDGDEYIARRNGWGGNPGLVVYINNSNTWQEKWIPTNWANTRIKDYTGASGWEPVTQNDTWVKIQCPPNSYSIWSVK